MLEIQNNGPEIISTNYFETTHAARGLVYLSLNAGAFRLLVPNVNESMIAEMRTGKEVVASRGPWPEQRQTEAMELLFEDGTDEPFCLHLGAGQIDRFPAPGDVGKQWIFSVWIKGRDGIVKALEIPCYYRIVKKLPWMKPR